MQNTTAMHIPHDEKTGVAHALRETRDAVVLNIRKLKTDDDFAAFFSTLAGWANENLAQLPARTSSGSTQAANARGEANAG